MLFPALLAVAILSGCREPAGDGDAHAGAPITVETAADPVTVHIGDIVRYRITVTALSNVSFSIPRYDAELGGFAIVDWSFSPRSPLPGGRVRETHTYALDTYVIDTYEIPAPAVSYELNGLTNSVAGPPVCVDVVSVTSDTNAFEGIRDIKGPVTIAREEPSRIRYILVAIAAALLAALLILVLRRARRARETVAPPPVPAHERAYAALRLLRDEHLVEKGRIKPYYTGLSHILRSYIEDRFGLRAPERTTEEFLQELSGNELLRTRYRGLLANFLKESDLVKFANYSVDRDDAERAYETATTFVDKTKLTAGQTPAPQEDAQ